MLYVGKAKNLKNRTNSYRQLKQLRGKTRTLVLEAQTLKFRELESELEALLVEAELIRTYQPHFNILLKDDKSPLYIGITKDTFPRVITLRKPETNEIPLSAMYGPFPSGFKVKEVLAIARKIFPWCSGATKRGKACFYYHLDLCPGACVDAIAPEAYKKNIDHLKLFLRGQRDSVLQHLKKEMKVAAETQQYEQAAKLRDQLVAIEDVTKREYRLKPDLEVYQLLQDNPDQTLILLRREISSWVPIPNTFELRRIECYDVSNISGTDATVAMTVAINGQIDHSQYRIFHIRTKDTPDDYHMMKEALQRRQNHPEWGMPDLLVIDGGKGQVRAALSVLQWSMPTIGIAKDPDRLVLPNILPPLSGRTVKWQLNELPPNHPGLQLVQQLRDEAHRFSKKHHHMLHTKTVLELDK